MAKILSHLRIARVRRTSVQNTEETFEIDFALGLKQGLEIHAIEFGMRQMILVPGAAPITAQGHMSIHVETGALEGAIDSFPEDEVVMNSEIIAETTMQLISGDTAQVEGVITMEWLQPKSWNFNEISGKPLLIAQNPTFRVVTSVSTLTMNGPQATFFYRYVELTTTELAEQFAVRR